MKRKILAGAIALTMGSVAANASTIVEAVKSELRSEGMIVQDRNSMTAFVDCLVSDAEICQNYANTSLYYNGNLFPCPVTGCTEASPSLIIPIGDSTIEIPASATWTLDTNEAMVMYGVLPPGVTHFGFETLVYERVEPLLPNPGDRTPLLEGENQPDPKRVTGVVIDAAVGETRNEFTMKNIPNPEALGEGQVFVHIATPNQVLAEEIKQTFVANGYPEAGINIKGLPEEYFNFGNDPETADTFRIIGRYARPFVSEEEFVNWTDSQPLQLMRVTASQGIGYTPFPVEIELNRLTGTHELEKGGNGDYNKWLSDTKKEYGKPDSEATVIPRDYSAQHCIETGSYCWGNNLDALYVDINDPETGKMLVVDFNDPESQLVITGIDHVATNYAKFWNFGFYHPETGKSIDTIDFNEVQLQEYKDGKTVKDKNNPVSYAKRVGLDGSLFRLVVKADCSNQENCYEVDASLSGGKAKVMMRTYVNPQTGTGPDFTEVENPEFWVYKN